MLVRSDINVAYNERSGVDDPQKLSGFPDDCWLRGILFSQLLGPASPTSAGTFLILLSSDPSDILIAFGVPYLFCAQNFFVPEDSYVQLEDGLWVTSAMTDALANFSINVLYT